MCTPPTDSAFVAAVSEYLSELGLTVCRHVIDDEEGLRAFIGALTSDSTQTHAAVLPVEAQPISLDGASAIGGGGLSPLATAALEISAAVLTTNRCVAVAQIGDPTAYAATSIEVLRLANSKETRSTLKQRLSDAGCMIAGQLLKDDQPKSQFEFPRDWWGLNGESQVTPSFTEFLVDSAFNRELTQTKLQEEAMERVRHARELDLKYHYVGWKMAENWNALTDDGTYGHEAHRRKLSGEIRGLKAVLPQDVSFRYVSLGPGDGKTDAALLPALANEMTISSCFFVDVSIELLQVATNRVITELIEPGAFSPRHIRAVLGDFEDSLSKLAPVLSGPGDRSFFSLSGFTIGNSKERALLQSLGDGMQPGDFLLLDARLHGLGTVTSISDEQKETLLQPYRSPAMQKFAFGPVEDLCDYTVRLSEPDIHIHYEPKIGTNFTTDVSHAINVYIDAEGLYGTTAFRKKVGLRAPATLPGIHGREKKKRLRLVTLTFYDFESLAAWFDKTGQFKVRWKRDLDRIGVFLLERVADDTP